MSLSTLSKRPIGRCPRCKEFIDLSALQCRFCMKAFNAHEAQKLRDLQEGIDRDAAARNDAKSLRYVLVDFGKDLGRILVEILRHGLHG